MTMRAKAAAGIGDDEVMATSKRKAGDASVVASRAKKAKQTQVTGSTHGNDGISDLSGTAAAPDILSTTAPATTKQLGTTKPQGPTRPLAPIKPTVAASGNHPLTQLVSNGTSHHTVVLSEDDSENNGNAVKPSVETAKEELL